MIKEELKNNLIRIGLCEENEYLDKYVDLICNNQVSLDLKGINRHHIIPKHYFKYNGLEIDNSDNNIAVLLYKDHVLAHHYLYNCSKDIRYKNANLQSIFYVLDKYNLSLENFDKLDFDLLQKEYEELCKYLSERNSGEGNGRFGLEVSDETRDKLSSSIKEYWRKLKLENPDYVGNRKGCTLSEKQIESLKEGNRKHFENKEKVKLACEKGWETRRKRGTTHTTNGLKMYNNGEIEIRANEKPEGFEEGMLSGTKNKISNALKEHFKNEDEEHKKVRVEKIKIAVANRSEERKQEIHDTLSKASKKVWENYSEEEYSNICEIRRQCLLEYYKNLSEEDKKKRSEAISKSLKGKKNYENIITGEHKRLSPDEVTDEWKLITYGFFVNLETKKVTRLRTDIPIPEGFIKKSEYNGEIIK